MLCCAEEVLAESEREAMDPRRQIALIAGQTDMLLLDTLLF